MFSVEEMQLQMGKIHNVDCLEFMHQVPDGYFDLVLTDPPYGINAYANGTMGGGVLAKQSTYKKTNWDSKIPTIEVFQELCRISKNQIIFGGNYFIEYLKNSSCWLVWDKDNGDNYFADCELAWTNFNTAVRKYKFKWQGMLQADMKNKESRYHPTQKPVKLFTAILQDYAKSGMKIFDPFMGSGTSAIASESLGLEWCGCERVSSRKGWRGIPICLLAGC